MQFKTVFQTQRIQHVFKWQVRSRHFRVAGNCVARQGLVHVKPGVAQAHLAMNSVGKTNLAVRASAYAQIVAKLPIVVVVKAAVPRLGEGRDLVARQPCGLRHVGYFVEHVVGQVFFRNHRWELGKVGVGLNRQVVN